MSEIILLITISWILAINANDDFIINNMGCKMPNFPAFSEETNPIFMALPYINCTDSDILTYTSIENNTAYLHIQQEYINQYYSSQDSIDCCYSYVKRNGTESEPDVGISISSCESFNSTVTLEEDIVMVKCFLGADKIYQNVHTTIVVKENLANKIRNLTENSNLLKKRPLSVVIIVLDGVSRLNLERTMPVSRRFLIENNFTEMMGYNKIDDNTFPNFNALLTGLDLAESNFFCAPEEVGGLDKCPMIWYDFRKQGYATAYAEDWPEISTYNYLKKGFENPPTDYYFKPYMEAARSLGTMGVDTMPYCAGPESQGERVMKVAKDFALTFKDQPKFGIFWMNTFSHNYINSPSRMDLKFTTFLEDLKAGGIFNDSMVVLLADHGVRFGEIRQTIQGWYEERLPMNFISLPPWFKEKYPKKYENLQTNSQRLTSTYDLYMTLQEVLASSVKNYTVKHSVSCFRCKSLFSEIPPVRDCYNAGIKQAWCTCIGKFSKEHPSLTPDLIKVALKFVMDSNVLRPPATSINKVLSSSITYHQRRSYILITFEADDSYVHQVLLKGTGRPLRFSSVIRMTKLGMA